MRLLVLNWRDEAHPMAGGAERYVQTVARRWAGQGHDVTLFASAPPGLPATERRDGVRIVRRGGTWSVYREARRSLRSAGAWDAVLESVNTRPFFAHRALPDTRVVALIHQLAREIWFHEAPLPVAALGRFVLEPAWLRAYRSVPVVAPSASTAADLAAIGVRDVSIVPPGSDRPPPDPGRGPAAGPTLLYVGRLRRSKRPDAAVAAWDLVRRTLPEARMWVVGDGPLRRDLEARPTPGLTVFGRVDEATKWRLLAQADLLLVPSVREGWGIVVIEAASVGTPSIAYRVPGLTDSIRDGRTGWLCEPSPEAMARSAIEALRSPGRLEMAGRAAASWATRFTWEDAADRILARLADRAPAIA